LVLRYPGPELSGGVEGEVLKPAVLGTPPVGTGFGVSFSGGKDSTLALWRSVQAGASPKVLVNVLTEGGQRSRSHGLHKSLLQAQAQALGLPMVFKSATWADYEARFTEALGELAYLGIKDMVFGDIDLEDHRVWEEKVCAQAGLTCYLPLYQQNRVALTEEFIAAGFKAVLVAVQAERLSADFLGRVLDSQLVRELAALGVDPCGEEGEYHSLVTDGPLFAQSLVVSPGEKVLKEGYWFLDLKLS